MNKPIAQDVARRPGAGRGGFAMILALAMLAVIVVVCTVVMTGVASQVKLVGRGAQGAQLRQLLLAGAQEARAALDAGSTGNVAVPLPRELSDGGAGLAVHLGNVKDGQVSVEVDARSDERHMSQQLTFRQDEGRWRLVSAQLR
jgi:hypothetical protein